MENQMMTLRDNQQALYNKMQQLAEYTAQLENQQRNWQRISLDKVKQLITAQEKTARNVMIYRKLVLATGQREAQKSILDLEFRQSIIKGLKDLREIPSLRNGTVYQQHLEEGIIASRELYRFELNKAATFQAEFPALNSTYGTTLLRARSLLQQLHNLTNQTMASQKPIDLFPSFTLANIERINFTLHWKPINHSSILTNYNNVLETAIHCVLDFGESIVKGAADLGKTIIHEGADLVSAGFNQVTGILTGPLKSVGFAVLYVAIGIVGLVMLLKCLPYMRKVRMYTNKQAMKIVQRLQTNNSTLLPRNDASKV